MAPTCAQRRAAAPGAAFFFSVSVVFRPGSSVLLLELPMHFRRGGRRGGKSRIGGVRL